MCVYENAVRELFSCEQFKKGAEAKGHQVNMVQSLRRLYEKWRYLCIKRWHGWNTRNVSESRCTCTGYSGLFLWNQCQMKTFIDRTYPIWQHLGKKRSLLYYIGWSGRGHHWKTAWWSGWFCRTSGRIQDCRKDICSKRDGCRISQKSKCFQKSLWYGIFRSKCWEIESWRIKLIKNKGIIIDVIKAKKFK